MSSFLSSFDSEPPQMVPNLAKYVPMFCFYLEKNYWNTLSFEQRIIRQSNEEGKHESSNRQEKRCLTRQEILIDGASAISI